MKIRKFIYNFGEEIVKVFGFTIICMTVFCFLFGEDGKGYSSFFSLGKEGLAVDTILQFLMFSVLIVALRRLFFTDGLIQKMPMVIRKIGIYVSVLVLLVLFVILFQWFPIANIKAWIMCLLCFAGCATFSTIHYVVKEKEENKKMEEALQKLKNGD